MKNFDLVLKVLTEELNDKTQMSYDLENMSEEGYAKISELVEEVAELDVNSYKDVTTATKVYKVKDGGFVGLHLVTELGHYSSMTVDDVYHQMGVFPMKEVKVVSYEEIK